MRLKAERHAASLGVLIACMFDMADGGKPPKGVALGVFGLPRGDANCSWPLGVAMIASPKFNPLGVETADWFDTERDERGVKKGGDAPD